MPYTTVTMASPAVSAGDTRHFRIVPQSDSIACKGARRASGFTEIPNCRASAEAREAFGDILAILIFSILVLVLVVNVATGTRVQSGGEGVILGSARKDMAEQKREILLDLAAMKVGSDEERDRLRSRGDASTKAEVSMPQYGIYA